MAHKYLPNCVKGLGQSVMKIQTSGDKKNGFSGHSKCTKPHLFLLKEFLWLYPESA